MRDERTAVHSLIKALEYGIQLSEVCIEKYAQEMKAQEAFLRVDLEDYDR